MKRHLITLAMILACLGLYHVAFAPKQAQPQPLGISWTIPHDFRTAGSLTVDNGAYISNSAWVSGAIYLNLTPVPEVGPSGPTGPSGPSGPTGPAGGGGGESLWIADTAFISPTMLTPITVAAGISIYDDSGNPVAIIDREGLSVNGDASVVTLTVSGPLTVNQEGQTALTVVGNAAIDGDIEATGSIVGQGIFAVSEMECEGDISGGTLSAQTYLGVDGLADISSLLVRGGLRLPFAIYTAYSNTTTLDLGGSVAFAADTAQESDCNIDTFANGTHDNGSMLWFYCDTGAGYGLTLHDGDGNLKMSGDFAMGDTDMIVFVYMMGYYVEWARSDN